MRLKTAVIIHGDYPGPGQYSPATKPTDPNPTTAVVGREIRGKEYGTGKMAPGPGAYMHPSSLNRGSGYSFGKAKIQQKPGDIPGPGTYKVPTTVARVPSYAIPGRSKEFDFV